MAWADLIDSSVVQLMRELHLLGCYHKKNPHLRWWQVYFIEQKKEHYLEYTEIDVCNMSKELVKLSIEQCTSHLVSYNDKR
jgi:hypothetical protein